jgi:hypothetical protein
MIIHSRQPKPANEPIGDWPTQTAEEAYQELKDAWEGYDDETQTTKSGLALWKDPA